MERIQYLAGFFDGEGCIVLRRGRKTPTLTVTQVDPRPLRLFEEEFGGRVTKRQAPRKEAHRQAYRWDIHAGAVQALVRMRPFLIVKAEQADLAIEAAKGSSSWFARNPEAIVRHPFTRYPPRQEADHGPQGQADQEAGHRGG